MNFYYCRLNKLLEDKENRLISQMNFYYCRYKEQGGTQPKTNKPNEFLLL